MVTSIDFHTVPYCDDRHELVLHAHGRHARTIRNELHVEPMDPLNNCRRLNISRKPTVMNQLKWCDDIKPKKKGKKKRNERQQYNIPEDVLVRVLDKCNYYSKMKPVNF